MHSLSLSIASRRRRIVAYRPSCLTRAGSTVRTWRWSDDDWTGDRPAVAGASARAVWELGMGAREGKGAGKGGPCVSGVSLSTAVHWRAPMSAHLPPPAAHCPPPFEIFITGDGGRARVQGGRGAILVWFSDFFTASTLGPLGCTRRSGRPLDSDA